MATKKQKAAKKAWKARKRRYGKNGLSPKGERAIARSNKRR